MKMYDDHELRVEVKVRALRPRPYKWEIYEGNEPMWIEQSKDSFSSEAKAREAARPALERLWAKQRGKS